MITTEHKRGIFALMVGHCAGMMDLVALPVWVGTLIGRYEFDPQQAGGLVTIFMIGVAIASLTLAPRLSQFAAKRMAVTGFGLTALVLAFATQITAFAVLAAIHLVGGLSAGMALTFTHGTIGRSQRPHRTFALANLAIGVFGIIYLGATPKLIEANGGPTLFWSLAAVMGFAFLLALFCFPTSSNVQDSTSAKLPETARAPLGKAVWLAVIAVGFMLMVQAMTISFYERVGMARGFGKEAVITALIIYGIVTIVPGPLAGLLEKRLNAVKVVCLFPILQAVAGFLIFTTKAYPVYVFAGSLMVFTTIFTHTFVFGLLARLDPTGRVVAATPAMIMVGAATGPFVSGTLLKFSGYEAIGYGVVFMVAIQLLFYNLSRLSMTAPTLPANSPAINAH